MAPAHTSQAKPTHTHSIICTHWQSHMHTATTGIAVPVHTCTACALAISRTPISTHTRPAVPSYVDAMKPRALIPLHSCRSSLFQTAPPQSSQAHTHTHAQHCTPAPRSAKPASCQLSHLLQCARCCCRQAAAPAACATVCMPVSHFAHCTACHCFSCALSLIRSALAAVTPQLTAATFTALSHNRPIWQHARPAKKHPMWPRRVPGIERLAAPRSATPQCCTH